MTEILLVKTENRVEGMKKIFSHYKDKFSSYQGKRIIIKPNFNTADPPPASTDMSLLKILIEHLNTKNPEKISVIERSGPVDTEETMRSKGLFELQQEMGFEVIDLTHLPEDEWVHIRPEEGKSNWKDGFLFPKQYMDPDAIIITLPCLKTHQFGGHFTLSLKLSVGMVPRVGYMSELHSSPHQRKLITEINQAYTPSMIILDGVNAFVKGGPARGELVHPNVLLCGDDRIAIDAVGVAILRDFGTTPEVEKGAIFEQEQIARAVELNLGVNSPNDIDIVGIDEESQRYADHLKTFLT